MHLNSFKESNSKTAEATGVSKTSPQNNLEKLTNKEEEIGFDKEIPNERYISPET